MPFAVDVVDDTEEGVLYFYRLEGPKPQATAGGGETYSAAAVVDAISLCNELIDCGGPDFGQPTPSDLAVWLQNQHDDKADVEAVLAIAPIVRRVWDRKCNDDDEETRPETTRTANKGGA